MKGLYVNVFRDAGCDCTAGGITSKVNTILLIDEQLHGCMEIKEDEVYLTLVRRNIFPNEPNENPYIHAVPTINGKPAFGGMFGGNFVYTSDSRVRRINAYPIPVHDRFENQY